MAQERNSGRVLRWSLYTSALLLCVSLFRYALADMMTFFAPFVELAAWGSVFVVLIWSLVYSVIALKTERLRAFIPLSISLTALLIAIFFPFNQLDINRNFSSHLKERTVIVEEIQSGQLTPNVDYNASLIKLPSDHQDLSAGGGEVVYEQYENGFAVFFFRMRILDGASGFIYRSDDNPPCATDSLGDLSQIKKLRDHWFWAVLG